MVKRAEDMVKLYNEHMRGGDGTVEIIRYLEPEEFNGNAKMIAKLVLKPGCSIGEHPHQPDAEFCYMLEGELTILDNGKEHTVYPGDAWMCGDGAVHYSKNTSDKPAVFLAMVVE